MGSPPSPATPPVKPTLPRSKNPRPASAQSTPGPSLLPRRPSVPHSQPLPASLPSLPSTASSSQSSATSSAKPTPLTSASMPPPPSTGDKGSSSVLGSRAGKGPSAASSSASVHGLAQTAISSMGGEGSGAPQTGASRMAAAAKRGQAGFDGMSKKEEDDHPLSERSLKARDYRTVHTLNRLFHLPARWNLVRPLGQGAYGLVISVQDSLSGEPVAVKCITRVFDKVILARRALREITLLRHFGEHENLTGLIDLDNVWGGYNEIYLYMEPMEADLHQIVRSGQALSNSHIQYLVYQLMRGMKVGLSSYQRLIKQYIHSANVIHRDLKPGNLLVNSDCELKICDFGLARGFRPVTGEADQNEGLRMTEHVATRWYRAPEIMLSNRRYTTAIDVWSIGCIVAELLGGKPLFQGKDYVDQLNLILGVLGTPDDETLERVASEKACQYIRTLPQCPAQLLSEILPNAGPDALDLLSRLLTFDPSIRLDVIQALSHPYVGHYHDEADEPSCPELFSKWETVESLETIEELREAISREISEYRAEVRAVEEDDLPEWKGEGEEILLEPSSYTAEPTGLSSEPGLSPKILQLAELGISPRAGPNFLRASRSRERESTPPTPATAQSEESFGAPYSAELGGGRTSRRSSGYSVIGRRPNAFLFSSPLGAGMTHMTSVRPGPANLEGQPGGGMNGGGGGMSGTSTWNGRRSRAASQAGTNGEVVASLRPLIRQLSAVGLVEQGKRDRDSGSGGQAADLPGQGGLPPLNVSPSDAPPSETPKSFEK